MKTHDDEQHSERGGRTPGRLSFWAETGTEGGYWAFEQDGRQGYDALHVLQDGDWLRVFNRDGSVRWEGRIELRAYPVFSQSVRNLWIHADQVGVEREFWAEMFFEQLRAEISYSQNARKGGESDHLG